MTSDLARLFQPPLTVPFQKTDEHRDDLVEQGYALHGLSRVHRFFLTKISRQAAHPTAEPRAISKNLKRSAGPNFPLPPAMLKTMAVLSLSSWF